MVAGRLRWFASSKQQDVPSTSCMADSSLTSEGGAMMVDASINVLSDDAACKATRRCVKQVDPDCLLSSCSTTAEMQLQTDG